MTGFGVGPLRGQPFVSSYVGVKEKIWGEPSCLALPASWKRMFSAQESLGVTETKASCSLAQNTGKKLLFPKWKGTKTATGEKEVVGDTSQVPPSPWQCEARTFVFKYALSRLIW